MSENKRNGRGSAGGYYIALILCAAAVGVTSYLYARSAGTVQTALQETFPDTLPVQEETESDVPVLATEVQTPVTEATTPVVATEGSAALKTGSPVAGETIVGYSMEALSYNQTTRDWRVHNGVDIAAEAGTPVLAAADGVVYTVYEDNSLGHTVVIRHNGGYITRYSSLSEDLAVQAGDAVTLGQTIGYASDSALIETGLGNHVHFSVSYQDAPMDPAEFLALGA